MPNRYQFSDVKNWRLVHETKLEAEPVPHEILNKYYPIGDYTIPAPFFSPIVGVFVSSSDDPGHWNKAGFAKQQQRADLDLAVAPDLVIRTQRLNLRKTTVCFFEEAKLGTYIVKIVAIPFWLRDYTRIRRSSAESFVYASLAIVYDPSINRQQLGIKTRY